MFSAAIKSGAAAASAPVDAQFNYVTMLLHGDGTNGANNGGVNTSGVTPFNTDASTNAFAVTINGDTKPNNFNPYQAGYYGNYFPSGSMLSTAYSSAFDFGTGDFTMEAWVNLDSLPAPQTIFSCVDAGATVGYSLLILANGFVEVDVVAAQSFICNSNPVQAKTWTHVAFTKSSGTYRAFVNGSLCTTSANTLGTTINSTSQGMCVARSVASGYNFPLAGYISNARIVKGTALYTSSFTPSTTPLTAVSGTSLLTCQSNRFIDNSASPFTLSLTGTPSVSYNQPFTVPSTYSTYGAGYFDGTGDYLTIPDNAAFNLSGGDYTLEAWIYWDGNTADYRAIIAKRIPGSSTAWEIFLNITTGTLGFYDDVIRDSGVKPTPNAWNHVAACWNNATSQINLYLNGARVLQTSATNVNRSADVVIGTRYTGSTTENYIGYMSNVRVVKGTQLYTGTTYTVPTAPLTSISGTSLLTLQTNGPVNDNGFVDSSPNNFAITRNGNTTQGSFSPYGSNWSNAFATNSVVQFPYTSALTSWWTQDFTIEMWVFNNTNAGSGLGGLPLQFAHGVYTEASTYWSFGTNASGQLVFYYYNGSANSVTSTTTAPLGTWNHVAMVYTHSSGNISLYLNGVSVASASKSGTPQNSGSNTVNIGAAQATYYNGYISNLRVLNGTALYNSTFTPSTTPLTAITNTQLLTCQSNRFKDNSANNAISTAIGTPSVQRFNPFGTSTAYSTATIGGSGYFDGTGDYLSWTGTALSTGDFTAEAWIYPTSFASSFVPFAFGTSDTSGHSEIIIQTNGSILWYASNTTRITSSSGAIVANAWQHIAVCRSSGTTKLFVNGVQVGSNFTDSLNYTATSFLLGTGYGGIVPINGYISNFRQTNSALYTTAFTPSTTPLTAVSGTQTLFNMTNAGIYDNAMMNDSETVGNAQISTSVKKYGTGSMYFDGSGDYLVAPNTASTALLGGNFTVEAWINPTAITTYHGIYSTTNAAGSSYSFEIYITPSGTIVLYCKDSSGTYIISGLQSSATISTGAWTHVAVVRNGSTFTIFVNGVSSASTTGTGIINQDAVQKVGWVTSTYYFNGYIDDLRITKGYARYTANFTPPTAAFPNIGPVSS